MNNKFTHKGYGRIYVRSEEDILKVEAIIKELDEFEYDYLPDKLIATFDNYPYLKYLHKFSDMDMNKLTAECWKRGIYIFVLDNGNQEFIHE